MIFPKFFVIGKICFASAYHEHDGWHLDWLNEKNEQEAMIFQDDDDMYDHIKSLIPGIEYDILYGPIHGKR